MPDEMERAVMSSHQRPKTYGKVSRKFILDNSNLTVDDSVSLVGESSRNDSQHEARGANNALEDGSMRSPFLSTTRQFVESENLGHLISPSNDPRITRPYQEPNYTLTRQISTSHERNLMPGKLDDNVFDVPSSGEENYSRQSSGNGRSKRKRRKLLAGVAKNGTNIVYDDESLQRHIATEAKNEQARPSHCEAPMVSNRISTGSQMQAIFKDPHHKQDLWSQASSKHRNVQTSEISQEICTITTEQKTSKGGPTIRPKAVNSTQRKRQDFVNGSLQACLPRIEKVSYKKMTPCHVLRPEPPENANCEIKSPPKTTTIISKSPNTPRRLTTAKRATTPRQLQLWNMLLKDGSQDSNSIPVKPAISSISKYQDARFLQNSISQKDGLIVQNPVSDIFHRRRRLVDNLNSRDDQLCNPLEESEANLDSSFSLGPEDPGTTRTTRRLDPASIPAETQLSINHASVLSSHPPAGGLKVTYARQRSYLTEDDLGQAATSDLSITNDSIHVARWKRREIEETTSRFQNLESFDEGLDEIANSQGSTMRSIHELREAGGNARVFSEMDAMLDDIDEACSVSLTHKRSRLFDLTVKFQDSAFCRLFLDQGLEFRIFPHLESVNDLLIDALFAVILLYLLASSTSIPKLSHLDSRVKSFVVKKLDEGQDLTLSTKDFDLSKNAQAEFKNLWDTLLKSSVWRAGNPVTLTPCVICLQCIEYLVRHAREMGCMKTLLFEQDIRNVVRILELDPIGSTRRPRCLRSTVEMKLSISILESCTVSNPVPCEDTPWTGHTLDLVVGLLPLLDTRLEEDIGTLRTLTLRLYLNLTNNNPALCIAFSRPEVIGSMLNIIVSHFQRLSENATPQNPEVLLDNLILSLGSMINLAEWCDAVRPLVLNLRFGEICFLDTLLQLFMSKQKEAAEVRLNLPVHDFFSNPGRFFPRKRPASTWLLATCQFFSVTSVSMG